MAQSKPTRDQGKEAIGWASLIGILFLFPALFFLCVFLPIWLDWTPAFP